MNVKLEKRPLPPTRHSWPFSEMEVGHCFRVPEDKLKSVRTSAVHYASKHAGVKFSVRTINGKIFCWRVS